ncbi:mannose-1-phosphate guanylyltransferase [Phenylobacterium sp.]|uniref:mannose-1-phosphate guanylyltransferase n=1 Tax=Phenylobacterium sp. TaxID=1871053 RepID=UPI002717AB48|nr:sugar phosphate nucleotidyltransferase [Phenylobacterium sp.]MDO8799472.1 sugar phosphate nucleotidyltransferase [Phenylobacterium sp.]
MTSKITPILMSGGAGTRLWPLSRQAKPKQFHRLGGPQTLIQATAMRVTGPMFNPPIVVCAASHADLTRAQLAEVGITAQALIAEPAPRNTAAASVAAAAVAAEIDPDGVFILLHADNLVADVPAMHAAIEAGRAAAQSGEVVIFSLKPTGPETIYGYIRAGAGEGLVRKVAQFVEKPDLETAKVFVADPDYGWNAGMFMFSARAFLDECRRLAPAICAAAEAGVAKAQRPGDVIALAPDFLSAPSEAIDTAIMEKTDRASVVGADIGWSDVGNWHALWEGSVRNGDGNALDGDAIAVDSRGNIARTDGPVVVLAGVEDLVVVVENGVVLVTRRESTSSVKAAVEALKTQGRGELL